MGHIVDRVEITPGPKAIRSKNNRDIVTQQRKVRNAQNRRGLEALDDFASTLPSFAYGRIRPNETYAEAFSLWFNTKGNSSPEIKEVAEAYDWPQRYPKVLQQEGTFDLDLGPNVNSDITADPMVSQEGLVRIGPNTGTRSKLKNKEAGDKNLIFDATTTSKLPEELRNKISAALDNLGVTQESLQNNIEKVLQKAFDESNGDPEGLDWYDQANEIAANLGEYGLSGQEAAALLAATSPQQSWSDNITGSQYAAKSLFEDHNIQIDDLLNTVITKPVKEYGKSVVLTLNMYQWAKRELEGFDGNRSMDGSKKRMPSPDELLNSSLSDLDPYVAASLIKAHGQMGYKTSGVGDNVDGSRLTSVDDVTGRTTSVRWTSGVQHLGRGVRVARGEDPNEILNGHKVRSFYNNINGVDSGDINTADVTVDVHAFSAAMGKKFGSSSKEYKYFADGTSFNNFPGVNSATAGVSGVYAPFADAYRRVAEKYNLTPMQVQAIVWRQWRKDNPDASRASFTPSQVDDIVEDYIEETEK
jgi:hypothetical protein